MADENLVDGRRRQKVEVVFHVREPLTFAENRGKRRRVEPNLPLVECEQELLTNLRTFILSSNDSSSLHLS